MRQQLNCSCLATALKSCESACSQTLRWSADPTKSRRNFGTCFSLVRILSWEGLLWTLKHRKQFCVWGFVEFRFLYFLNKSICKWLKILACDIDSSRCDRLELDKKKIKNSYRKHGQSLLSPKITKQKALLYGWAAIFPLRSFECLI